MLQFVCTMSISRSFAHNGRTQINENNYVARARARSLARPPASYLSHTESVHYFTQPDIHAAVDARLLTPAWRHRAWPSGGFFLTSSSLKCCHLQDVDHKMKQWTNSCACVMKHSADQCDNSKQRAREEKNGVILKWCTRLKRAIVSFRWLNQEWER